MKSTEIKEKILKKLSNAETSNIENMLKEYESQYPYDLEIYSMRGSYYFLIGEYKKAEDYFLSGMNINKFNFDIVYNLAILYETMGKSIEANKYYRIAYVIAESSIKGLENYSDFCEELLEKIKNFSSYFEKEKSMALSAEDLEKLVTKIKNHLKNIDSCFSYLIMDKFSHVDELYFNDYLKYDNNYYVAKYSRTGGGEDTKYHRYIEIMKVIDNKEFKNKNTVKIAKKSLLPILSKEYKPLVFEYKNRDYTFWNYAKEFYYYNLDSDIEIKTDDFIVGKPIELGYKKNRKKLVMSIFIDGLSQSILEEYGFENIMPNTYKYFDNSIYFTNFYSTAEWTYPSMAAYFTGMYTTRHKMYTNPIVNILPDDTKLLGELFNDRGYVCSKIDGDWRTCADMGYIRGFSRYVYGKYYEAMGVKDVIHEAIENIDLFKDTNQYLFINVSELHDIADYYKLKPSVYKNIDIDNLQTFEFVTGPSVLIQNDVRKETRYVEQIKYIDRQLNILYNHIRENFDEDEVIISLFSDHGQGYLLKEDDFFLADKRSKVPLIIKGVSDERKICDEYVSSVDYLNIMNKLANLYADLSDKDGNTPLFIGGDKKRDFVLTESIHPNRLYRASIRNEKYYFTFESKEMVRTDGRVPLDDYTAILMDKSGNLIDDKIKRKEYIDFIFEHMKQYIMY